MVLTFLEVAASSRVLGESGVGTNSFKSRGGEDGGRFQLDLVGGSLVGFKMGRKHTPGFWERKCVLGKCSTFAGSSPRPEIRRA